jgi:hypothetical protein
MLVAGAVVTGVDPAGSVTVISVQWHGTQAHTLFFRDAKAQPQERLVDRSDEGTFSIAEGTVGVELRR